MTSPPLRPCSPPPTRTPDQPPHDRRPAAWPLRRLGRAGLALAAALLAVACATPSVIAAMREGVSVSRSRKALPMPPAGPARQRWWRMRANVLQQIGRIDEALVDWSMNRHY